MSTGEARALTGAILGHSNPRSTAIYAHIQHEPSRRAANRVSKKIAAALSPKAVPTGPLTVEDQKLIRRSEEHTSDLQSLMRISYAVFCLKKKKHYKRKQQNKHPNAH